MSYITPETLVGMIPRNLMEDAAGDGGGFPDDVLRSVIEIAEKRVHRFLGPNFPRPLPPPVPELVTDAACIFAVYELYARNGIKPEDNPRSADADAAAADLRAAGAGTVPLTAEPDGQADGLVAEPNNVEYPQGTMV